MTRQLDYEKIKDKHIDRLKEKVKDTVVSEILDNAFSQFSLSSLEQIARHCDSTIELVKKFKDKDIPLNNADCSRLYILKMLRIDCRNAIEMSKGNHEIQLD